MKYLLLIPDTEPPEIHELKPFRAVVIIEKDVTPEWQNRISDWLVASGCLYMMAWGIDCSSWDDSVDYSIIEKWNYGHVPDDSFVMTTWHENEPLEEVFWFSKHDANHSHVNIENTVLVHISNSNKEAEFLEKYERV